MPIFSKRTRSSVRFRVVALFAIASLSYVLAITLAQRMALHRILIDQGHQQVAMTGEKIARTILEKLSAAETIAVNMAQVVSALPSDEALVEQIMVPLLSYSGLENVISGGGVWPEPYTFNVLKERYGIYYAWKNGELRRSEEYNNPLGEGYHHESWYVPMRYASADKCFWSDSYAGRQSRQAVLTCSVPVRNNNVFMGTATVEVSLVGLRDLIFDLTKELNGYAFIIDRNNNFVSFPFPEWIQKDSGAYGSLLDLAAMRPEFGYFHKKAEDWNAELIERTEKNGLNFASLGDILSEASFQISDEEGKLIAAQLAYNVLGSSIWSDSDYVDYMHEVDLLDMHMINDNSIIQGRALAASFLIPSTFWKLVLVVPEQELVGPANKVFWLVVGVATLLGIVLLALAFFMVEHILLKPLRQIQTSLNLMSVDDTENLKYVEVNGASEFQEIAQRFNDRTRGFIEAKNRAEESDRMKSEFLATMSHELRTPLNGVIGLSSLLEETELDEEQKGYLKDIHQSADILLTIINDILDVSRLETGRIELEQKAFNLFATITSLVDTMRHQAHAKDLHLKVNIEPETPLIAVGDSARLSQVLLNLVGNALKFTDKGGVFVRVRHEMTGDDEFLLHIIVRDTGIGISEEARGKLFEKFTQADASITRKFGGTGLGLAICKQLSELMGGSIEVESEIGKGSAFTAKVLMKMPSDDERRSVLLEDAQFGQSGLKDLTGKTILFAEDNDINQKVISGILREWKADVVLANNGADALECFEDRTFDLILMDVNMTEVSGIEATSEIRQKEQIERRNRTPIIAVTARAMTGDRDLCLQAGMDDYISKPVDKDVLQAKVFYWLSRRNTVGDLK